MRSCHERWDGRGYPDGLAGEEIPIAARIVFACDAYNAMTTDRPYRDAMPREAAIAELRANTGTQFDPKIVDALIKVVEQGAPVPVTTSDGVRAVLAGAPGPAERRRRQLAGSSQRCSRSARLPGVPQGDLESAQTSSAPTPAMTQHRSHTEGLDQSARGEERRRERPGAQAVPDAEVRAITLSSTVVWMSSRS